MDKPYAVTILKKSQASESAIGVCIDKDAIFARFNAIAAQNKILSDEFPPEKTNVSHEVYIFLHDFPV
ncbi:hypothetical protein T03_1674 [Trichinella britovi]|uniref:Uncharacterized protein n=1 Tax=Trichinella britovi TaxID=45882 RepID=A0A0V1B7B0_TRIBR|nr:hypothetical protein T03_1674 [Trichinella britovi]